MLAIATVGALAGHDAMRQSANAQADGIKRQAELQQNDLARQSEQQREAAAAQMNEHARAAAKDTALFDVLTGEYGGGNSADRARATMGLQQDENLATIQGNARAAAGENSFASLAVQSQAQARLASIQRPSKLGTALQIGGAAAGAWSQHNQLEAIKNNRKP